MFKVLVESGSVWYRGLRAYLPVRIARFDISNTGFFISGGQVGGPPIAPLLLQTTARNTSKKIPSAELQIEQDLGTTHLACQARNKSLSAGAKNEREISDTIHRELIRKHISVFWQRKTLDCKKKTVRHACEFDPVGQTRWTPENNVGLSVCLPSVDFIHFSDTLESNTVENKPPPLNL